MNDQCFILCDLLWKVQKSHAANRGGSFNYTLMAIWHTKVLIWQLPWYTMVYHLHVIFAWTMLYNDTVLFNSTIIYHCKPCMYISQTISYTFYVYKVPVLALWTNMILALKLFYEQNVQFFIFVVLHCIKLSLTFVGIYKKTSLYITEWVDPCKLPGCLSKIIWTILSTSNIIPTRGQSQIGSHVYFLLIIAMVILLWRQIVLLWHQNNIYIR